MLQRFLVFGGINGNADALLRLESMVRDTRPDGLLFAGGVLPVPCEGNVFGDFDPDNYPKKGALFVERFFATLGSLGKFSAVIPGVFDAPIDEFLRLGMAAELKYPKIHLVHVTPVEEGDIAVFGLGGSITDSTSPCVGHYSRTLAHYYLRPICNIKPRRTVLLLSDLPESWHGDLANERLVADALTARYRPAACIIGSPARRGVLNVSPKPWLFTPATSLTDLQPCSK